LTTAEFVAHLRRLDIRLSIDDERLRCSAPKGALTAALRDELAARKAEVVAWLRVNGDGRGAGFAASAAGAALTALAELVADRGYHSNQTLVDVRGVGVRSYIAEPDRGRRCWTKAPVYGNRRRVRGARGRRLIRRRGQYIERSFAHVYDTGGVRRTHLRGHENILKRLLVHAGAFNLGILLWTSRELAGPGSTSENAGCAGGHVGLEHEETVRVSDRESSGQPQILPARPGGPINPFIRFTRGRPRLPRRPSFSRIY
jgi:hypothetical protein